MSRLHAGFCPAPVDPVVRIAMGSDTVVIPCPANAADTVRLQLAEVLNHAYSNASLFTIHAQLTCSKSNGSTERGVDEVTGVGHAESGRY
ncbi:hypothetical protein FQR65_LT17652 [Abscondita terminalis]|nr:hypothetical protein FQR65_LT17652 [Abscondita terminalis]